MRDLTNEFLEKGSTFLDKVSVLIILILHISDVGAHGQLLRNGWDVAARPSIVQAALQGLELVEPPLTRPFTG